jgi:predicted PurR-regulated permease PerM
MDQTPTQPTPDTRAARDARILRQSLIIFLLIVLVLAFVMLRFFLADFVVAASIALLVTPVYRRLRRLLLGRSTVAALIVVALVTLLILVPVTLAVGMLAKQTVLAVEWSTNNLRGLGESSIYDTLVKRFPSLSSWLRIERALLSQMVTNVASRAAEGVNVLVQGIIARLTTAIFDLVIFVLMLFFLLRDGPLLRSRLARISPLSAEREGQILAHLERTVKGVLQAMIVVPIAQAVVAFFGFLLLGVPAPLLWSVFVFFAALIPLLGSPLGWVPAVVYLYFYGEPGRWIGMLIYGLVVISAIDNIVKPLLLRETAQIHPMLGFLAILGGVLAFGPLGFLIGPVVLSLLLSAELIYRLDILHGPQPPAAKPAGV